MNQHVNRRALVSAGSTVAMVPDLASLMTVHAESVATVAEIEELKGRPPAKLAAPALSPIMTLFEEWDAVFRLGYERLDASQEEVNDDCDRMRALEQQMEAIPSTSAADLAAKIIAVTGYGDFEISLSDKDDPITAEILSLLGRAKPELIAV